MADSGHAELVLTGGEVYRVDAARSWAQAVAVKDGRIAAVGTDARMRELVGPGTEVIDLRGRMVLPGFQDAHAHVSGGGLERAQCDLSGAQGLDECLRLVRGYAERHPHAEWLLGGGWSLALIPGRLPTREDLDRVVPDRPVALANREHHGAWVNSRALALGRTPQIRPTAGSNETPRAPPAGCCTRAPWT